MRHALNDYREENAKMKLVSLKESWPQVIKLRATTNSFIMNTSQQASHHAQGFSSCTSSLELVLSCRRSETLRSLPLS